MNFIRNTAPFFGIIHLTAFSLLSICEAIRPAVSIVRMNIGICILLSGFGIAYMVISGLLSGNKA